MTTAQAILAENYSLGPLRPTCQDPRRNLYIQYNRGSMSMSIEQEGFY